MNIKSLVNRRLNIRSIRKKVFCIGLHKTGTSSLYELATEYGFYPTHSTGWQKNKKQLAEYDFFCDGGSHFDDQNEFDLDFLLKKYPDAFYILQTRDTKEWVISKLKHAGWNQETIIAPDDPNKIIHDEWLYKSKLTIERFIEHKFNYERKVIEFFERNPNASFITLDITDDEKKEKELNRFKHFLNLHSLNNIKLPHRNKAKSKTSLSKEILDFIDQIIEKQELKRRIEA